MDPVPSLVATAVGLALLLAGWFTGRGDGPARFVGAALAALAAPVAFFTARTLLGDSTEVPPLVFRDWGLLTAAASVVLGALAAGGRALAGLAWVLAAAGLAYAFHAGTGTLHERYWGGEVLRWVGGLTAVGAVAVGTRLAQASASRPRAIEGMLALGLAGVAAAPTIGNSGSGLSAFIAGGIAGGAGLFGLVLAARRDQGEPTLAICRAAGLTQTVALGMVVANGVLFASVVPWHGAVLMLAPTLTLLPFGRGFWPSMIRLALVAGAVSVPPILVELAKEANPYG